MNYCKKPCNDCPFRKDSLAGWLSDYEPQELHNIVMGEHPFPCHLTHEEDLDWEEAGKKETPLCAEALLYMKKNAKMPRHPEVRQIMNQFTKEDCNNILSVPEFIKHHTIKKHKTWQQ